jgi:protein gp37
MSKIEWTRGEDGSEGKTWNPIRARNLETGEVGWFCEHMSHGCDHCYAEKMNVNTYFGNGLPYKASSLPQLELFLDEKMLMKPLSWRKGRKVFVCSMTDLFGRFVKDEWIDRIFAVMALAQQHTFQVLTKRPERMLSYLRERAAGGRHIWEAGQKIEMPRGQDKPEPGWPLPNVWLGVSCEDKETYQKRVIYLSQTPAAVRFISFEPLLSDVGDLMLDGICEGAYQWAIVGGESGTGARPMNLEWMRSIVEQCKAASVPVFCKQLGSNFTVNYYDHEYREEYQSHGWDWPEPIDWNTRDGQPPLHSRVQIKLRNRKGGDIAEFPEDLRIREFPT